MSLITNYFKTLLRTFSRNLSYSLINLFGLALGLATAFIIYIYVQDELAYDKHFDGYEKVYRIESHYVIKGKPDDFAITALPLGPTLKDEYPEVEEFTRLFNAGTVIFDKDEHSVQEDSIFFADSSHFKVLAHPLLHGDPHKSLTEPNTMVISKSFALRHFGKTDPRGEELKTNNDETYRITGVFEDLPWNTHIRYNALLSISSLARRIGDDNFNDRSSGSFWNINTYTFIKLAENSNSQGIIDKFPAFYDSYMRELGDQVQGSFYPGITPISMIHYNSGNLQFDNPGGNKSYLYILGLVGIFIILIAGINYMNLATARSARRSREVGMRKVSGAGKKSLIGQFLTESLILSLFAMIVAIIIIILVLPGFNELAGKNFNPEILLNPQILLTLLAITLFVGLTSGIYPAFYLSSFDPVKILKGTGSGGTTGAGLRRLLVVVQFAISAGLIIGSLVVSGQLNYMKNKDLGFDKDNLVVVMLNDTTVRRNLQAFKQELEKNPNIIGSTASTGLPGSYMNKQVVRLEGEDGALDEHAINNYAVDYDYLDVYNLTIDTGRFYQKEMPSDATKSFIVNDAAAHEFNWMNNAIGKRFQFNINLDGTAGRDGEIIGVIKDFNYTSLQNRIDPLALILSENDMSFRLLSVRIKEGTEKASVQWIEEVRNKFNPYYPYEYYFLSDKLDELYRSEIIINIIFRVFTLITLFVAALGLLGLSAFMTQQKTREIGVRKVHGSTSTQIVVMFLKQFSKWVILANLIAFPLAWYLLDGWLQDFYYRIDLSIVYFILAFFLTITVALITVFWQSWRASKLQPAISLKYE